MKTTTESKQQWTPEPLRDDGSGIGPYRTRSRQLVGGEDGQYPTIFIEAQCAKCDIARFEATVDRMRDCYNALAGCPDPERAVGASREAIRVALGELEACRDNPQGHSPLGCVSRLRSALALLGATTP